MTIFLTLGMTLGFIFGSGIATLTVLIHAMKNGYTDEVI
jgi:hypothetical protein